MANELNRVTIIGRLTRDPELKQVGQSQVCKISIANNRSYTSNGEKKGETSFFNCTAWGRQAEIIGQYCRKGKQVAIDGRLQQQTWQDQSGQKRSAVQIVIDHLQMLGGSEQSGSGKGQQAGSSNSYNSGQYTTHSSYSDKGDPFEGGNDYIPDDDVPF